MRAWLVMAGAAMAASALAAQEQFEVVSVKPNTSGRPGSDFNFQPGGGLNGHQRNPEGDDPVRL